MRTLGLALLLATVPAASYAAPQPVIQFETLVPADSGRIDVASDVLPVPGGALIVGWTSLGNTRPDGFVMRVNERGRLVWRKEIGGPGTDILFGIQPAGAGFVAAGFTSSRGAGGTDGWVIGLDAKGDTTWQRTFGGPGDDRLTSIEPTSNGWLVAGQTDHGGDLDAWVLRLDAQGKQLAEWTWGGPGTQRAFGVAAAADGGCVIAGSMGETDQADGFVTRLDSKGREKWVCRFDGPGRQVAYHVRTLQDRSILMTGYGYVDATRDFDALVARIRPDGKLVYQRQLGDDWVDRAVQSAVLPDGSTIVVGYSRPTSARDDEPVWQTRIYLLDAQGRPTWTRGLNGTGRESGRWVAADRDGAWIVGQVTVDGASHVQIARLGRPKR